jgi:glutamate racemase
VVDNYGAPELAAMAERMMLGEHVADDALRAQLAPAFFDDSRGRTDSIVLGCTHYPLITDALSRVAPWPVTWIDSSNAIAKRALTLAEGDATCSASIAYVTREEDIARYREIFTREGFEDVKALTLS